MTDIWDGHLKAIQDVIDSLKGDQAEISKISGRWRSLATTVTTHSGAVKRAVTPVNDAWNGDAATSFSTYMDRYPKAGTALSEALTTCADKLDAAGTALSTAKGEVQALYTEKRAWLDAERKTTDVISQTAINSQVADALARAEGPKKRASAAIQAATDLINGYLDDTTYFTSIPVPGDQDFMAKDPAKIWLPDPAYKPKGPGGTTQLAGYQPNGSAPQADNAAGGAPGGSSGTGGSGGSGGVYSRAVIQVPPNAHTLAKSPRAQALVDYALKQLGDPYVWAATGPNSFDCSGLTMRAAEAAGIKIPRVAADQWGQGPRIPDGKEQAGDLIFFDSTGDGVPDHVGIVLDPEKHTMIHAPNSHSVVRIDSYGSYSTPRVGITRPGMT